MTEHTNTHSCPSDILEWITWYGDAEALSPERRGAVESHAAGCASCREEIAILSGAQPVEVALPDPERAFARVLALVEHNRLQNADTLERPVAPAAVARPVGAPAHRRAPVRSHRRFSGRLGALAAGLALTITGAGLGAAASQLSLFDGLTGDGVPVYHTAAVAPAVGTDTAPAATLDVMFRSDAQIEKINTALRAIGGTLVSGPTQLGRYGLHLPVGSDATAAATLLQAEGTGVASFAGPARR